MARAKKDAKLCTFNLKTEVSEALSQYCEETGLSKTVAVEQFIQKGIQDYNENQKTNLSK